MPAMRTSRSHMCGRCAVALSLMLMIGGCTEFGQFLERLFEIEGPPAPGIVLLSPSSNTSVASGATVTVRWADVATVDGTVVSVEFIQLDANNNPVTTFTMLTGRDAFADDAGDSFDADTTGLFNARYRAAVVITAPDGQTARSESTAIIIIQ